MSRKYTLDHQTHVKGQGWAVDPDKVRKDVERAFVDAEGVLRWKSNDRVPPADVLNAFEDFIGGFDRAKTDAAYEKETQAFLAEYRRTHPGPSEEEKAEMRNAFGKGKTVVNIVTGKKTKL